MKKIKLDLNRLEIESFETECPCDDPTVPVISGKACITRPTVYGTCCTP